MTESNPKEEAYSDDETRERAAATLKVMLATPHKPHKAQKHVRSGTGQSDKD